MSKIEAFIKHFHMITLPLSYRYGNKVRGQMKEIKLENLLYLRTLLESVLEIEEIGGYFINDGEKITVTQEELPQLLELFVETEPDITLVKIISESLRSGNTIKSMLHNLHKWIMIATDYNLGETTFKNVLFEAPDVNKLVHYTKELSNLAKQRKNTIKTDTYTGPDRRKKTRVTSSNLNFKHQLKLGAFVNKHCASTIKQAHELLFTLRNEKVDDLICVFNTKTDDISDVGKVSNKIVAQLKLVKRIDATCNSFKKSF